MNIDNIKRVCIVGWGKSGFSLCNLLSALKKEIKLTEQKERKYFHPSLIDKLAGAGISFEFGGHSENFLKGCQLVILSPGVDPLNSPVVKIANNLNIPYVGEVEFAYWLTKAKFVAITGTNGKTTTTFLTYRVLRENKKRVFLGGNIGIPVSSFILDTKKGDLIVLEISSFQLETILEFKPYVSALLNIEPNHLDRHPTFNDYFRAKMNIFKNQQQTDFAVLNKNIEMLSDIEKKLNSKIVHFSSEFENQNFSCIYRIASIFGLGKADCLHVFNNFKGIPHRLQLVRVVNGVAFVNDSKSTNPSSTVWAFNNIKGNIVLIAGGKDKGVDYKSIIPYMKKVKKVNLFGQAAKKIEVALSGHVKTQIFPSLCDVVSASFKESSPKDTVLFSPMCSSFDMFNNYMERGRKFIEVVKSL
jgi:UDP-N-acetylmuramoylalanine--D-glutamate ligase